MNDAAKTVTSSPALDDSRKKMNFWMLRQMARPSRTASTIVAKLSSARTMSAAWRATSVPSFPIATPMCASRRAGRVVHPVARHRHDVTGAL